MQWEYRIQSEEIQRQNSQEDSAKTMNQLGLRGWELVAVQAPVPHTSRSVLVFKRRIAEAG